MSKVKICYLDSSFLKSFEMSTDICLVAVAISDSYNCLTSVLIMLAMSPLSNIDFQLEFIQYHILNYVAHFKIA